MEFVETYLKANSLTALYDSVLIPVLSTAEMDARAESLDQEQLVQVEQSLRDMIEDLNTRPVTPSKIVADQAVAEQTSEDSPAPILMPPCRVYCLPARATRDELAGTMLAQLLQQQGAEAQNAPPNWSRAS